MINEWQHDEIKWRTTVRYVDLATGEELTKEQVINEYDIVNKKRKTNVYKLRGSIEITNECWKSRQAKLF